MHQEPTSQMIGLKWEAFVKSEPLSLPTLLENQLDGLIQSVSSPVIKVNQS